MGNALCVPIYPRLATVHPHVHGERFNIIIMSALSIGSSPRTWGTHYVSLSTPAWLRFIPTYMGNAPLLRASDRSNTVHPHVHGERRFAIEVKRIDDGSSPRTWGTPGSVQGKPRSDRFIPTYMGNASTCRTPPTSRSVHPHVHGERGITDHPIKNSNGSSPRTWGTQPGRRAERDRPRFIPTYMGNALSPRSFVSSAPVHPHVHGERPHMPHMPL